MTGDRNGWAPIIRRRRNALELTQAQLADVAGVSEKTVTNAETEGKTPQRGTLDKLLPALGLPRDMDAARAHVLPSPTYIPTSEVDWRHDDVRTLIAHLLDRIADLEYAVARINAARPFSSLEPAPDREKRISLGEEVGEGLTPRSTDRGSGRPGRPDRGAADPDQ